MLLPRLVLLLSALAFAGIGAAFLARPQAMAHFVDVSLGSATADGDVRAVYGGLQLGIAAFLALAAGRPAWWRPALALQIAAFGGLAAARVLGWWLGGWPAPLGHALHGAEALGLAFGVLAWRRLPRSVGELSR